MGGIPLFAFTEEDAITRWRGKLLVWREAGCQLMPTFHPAALLRDLTERPAKMFRTNQTVGDIKQAFQHSRARPRLLKYETVLVGPDDIEGMFDELEDCAQVAVDIETTGLDYETDEILGISFSGDGVTGYYVPWDLVSEGEWHERLQLLGGGTQLIAHNAKFDLRFLRGAGVEWEVWMDTMLAHHMLDENFRHGLKPLAWLHTDLGGYDKGIKLGGEIPPEEIYEYAATDAIVTWRVSDVFFRGLEEQGLSDLFFDVTMPLLKVLIEMEELGIAVDAAYAKKRARSYRSQMTRAEKAAEKLVGPFEMSKLASVRDILYEKLRLPVMKKTKTGQASVDKEVLGLLKHPVCEQMLRWRRAQKVLSTYLIPYQKLGAAGRIHPSFNVTGTVTGRLSCSDPNLQNVDKDIVGVFVPMKGHKFVYPDFQQAELRVVTHYTQDPVFLDAFAKGQDIHTRTASEFYGKSMEQCGKGSKERFNAKSINFGLIYGRGAKDIGKQIGVSEYEAEDLVRRYFQRYHKTKEWMDRHIAEAHEVGYVTDPFGRRRRLPDIFSDDMEAIAEAERQALNSPIQAGAATATYIVMIRIWEWLKHEDVPARILLQVHDSIMLEVQNSVVDEVVAKVTELMEDPIPQLSVPMKADIKVMDRWEKD
jgi:DNA polymerase-1